MIMIYLKCLWILNELNVYYVLNVAFWPEYSVYIYMGIFLLELISKLSKLFLGGPLSTIGIQDQPQCCPPQATVLSP